MPDFRLNEEYEALRQTVRELAREVVAPVIGDFYERHAFPYEIVRQMGKMGLFGLPFPEEYGGMGGDYFALCLAIEELARVDSSVAVTLEAGVSLGAMPIYRYGTEEQRRQWLPRLASGEALAAFGLTEPGFGTDAGGTATRAVLDGDHWVINGSKAFITNSGTDITALVTVTAVTGANPDGSKEISSFIVSSGTPGFTVQPGYSRGGSRSRRSPSGWHRAAWTSPSATPSSGTRSAGRSVTSRRSSSRSLTWRRGRTPPGWPTTTRPPGWWPARTSSARRRSRSSTPARLRSPTPARRPRSTAGTASSTRRPWRASGATPRSLRSVRVPPKSSA